MYYLPKEIVIYKVATGSGILEKFGNSKVLFFKALKSQEFKSVSGKTYLGWKKTTFPVFTGKLHVTDNHPMSETMQTFSRTTVWQKLF